MRRNSCIHTIKRLTAVLAALLLLTIAMAPAAFAAVTPATSGACGDDLTWHYALGTLTIAGSGQMENYRENDMAPWYAFRNEITRVRFSDKMTSVGDMAFYDCDYLSAAVLPDSVKTVGNYAFSECDRLELLTLSKNLVSIGEGAFYHCQKLLNVTLPSGLTTLGARAFYRCESLVTVTLPVTLSSVGSSVFAYCTSLVRAEIACAMKALPEWTFYNCSNLTVVVLPASMNTIDGYALKECTSLSTVYFSGDKEKSEAILQEINKELPSFSNRGSVTSDPVANTVVSNQVSQNDDGETVYESITLRTEEDVTVVTFKETVYAEDNTASERTVSVSVTVESQNSWDNAVSAAQKTLDDIQTEHLTQDPTVTLYIKEGSAPTTAFMNAVAGEALSLTVVTEDGTTWHTDCSTLTQTTLTNDKQYNFSHEITSASDKTVEALGTDDCYKVTFSESAEVNAEILVKLPGELTGGNAFLYQVEDDGSHTRLQATAIDKEGNAHFYVAKVDKDTEYVVGVNVPDEKTDDVIIPDALLDDKTLQAIERLEKIEYVVTGVQSSWGMGFGTVTLILVGVLVATIAAVGVILGMWNKQRLKRGYVPDVSEYEDET